MSSTPEWSLVICSGGSGGHLFPALAVVEGLRAQANPPAQILVLSTPREIERRILEEDNLEHVPLPTPSGSDLFRKPLRSLWNLRKSIKVAERFIQDTPEPVVLGMGGFGSVPGVIAARNLGVSIILHEQNLIPGRTTSWLARWAKTVCISFEETRKHLPAGGHVVHTGNPVRREIADLARMEREPTENIVLVLGGSQGAKSINGTMTAFAAAHRTELAGWKIVHQTGESESQRIADSYKLHRVQAEVAPFFSDMAQRYRSAKLVVTRAGATSLAEIACAGLPALIVPYPNSVRNHQVANAQWYAQKGAAVIVEEQLRNEKGFREQFQSELLRLLGEQERLASMSAAMRPGAWPSAALHLANVIDTLLTEVAH